MDSNPYASPSAELLTAPSSPQPVAWETTSKLTSRRWVLVAFLVVQAPLALGMIVLTALSVGIAGVAGDARRIQRAVELALLTPATVWAAMMFLRALRSYARLKGEPTLAAIATHFRTMRLLGTSLAVQVGMSSLVVIPAELPVAASLSAFAFLSSDDARSCHDEARRLRNTLRVLLLLSIAWRAIAIAESLFTSATAFSIQVATLILIGIPLLAVWSYERALGAFVREPSSTTLDEVANGQQRVLTCAAYYFVISLVGLACMLYSVLALRLATWRTH